MVAAPHFCLPLSHDQTTVCSLKDSTHNRPALRDAQTHPVAVESPHTKDPAVIKLLFAK
jgi:hypothetical protein